MIDQKFTEELSKWLSTPRDERDVVAGAELLMRITGNRQFYATAIVRPHVVHDHVEYELKKHLAIRQEGHNVETLRNLERELLAECAEEFGEEASTAEPVEEQAEEGDAYAVPREAPVVSSPKRGRRADHDALPAEIQALYDDNATRYEQMRKVYQQLLTMSEAEPCDRKEHIFQLDQLVKSWAAAWEAYDRYDATSVSDAAEDEAEEASEASDAASEEDEAEEADEASPLPDDPTTFANKIAAAKRYLQKHRKKLRELEEAGAAPEELRAEEEKISAKQAELENLTTLTPKNKENE